MKILTLTKLSSFVVITLILSGCGESSLDAVKNSTTAYKENSSISLVKAFKTWDGCKELEWNSFRVDNKEIVEYSCEWENHEEFIQKISGQLKPIIPGLKDPKSVIIKFQWEVVGEEIKLLHVAKVWDYGEKVTYEEDVTYDGLLADAAGNADLFDMSIFSKYDMDAITSIYGPPIAQAYVLSSKSYKSKFIKNSTAVPLKDK